MVFFIRLTFNFPEAQLRYVNSRGFLYIRKRKMQLDPIVLMINIEPLPLDAYLQNT